MEIGMVLQVAEGVARSDLQRDGPVPGRASPPSPKRAPGDRPPVTISSSTADTESPTAATVGPP